MTKPNSAAALLAILSMLATPAAAAGLPAPGAGAQAPEYAPDTRIGEYEADRHRRYRYRRHRGVDLGDVLTGVLIIGGIAAVVDAVEDSEREREERRRDRDYRDRDYDRDRGPDADYGDRRSADRYARSVSAGQAAEACLEEVEQLGEVDDVDVIRRSGDGWRVEGRMEDGTPYSCEIGRDGRVRQIDNRGDRDGPFAARDDDGQSGVNYASARARQGGYASRGDDAGDVDGDLYPG